MDGNDSGRKDDGRVRVTEIGATAAYEQFTDIVTRAGYKSERIVITRNGRRVAALVSIEDLDRLETVAA